MSKHGRRLRGLVCAVLASVAVLSAACTTTASDNASATDSSDRGFLSETDFAALQENVKQGTAIPSFVAPGPAFDASKAKGKRVFVIPTASQLRQCDQIAKDVVMLAEKVGMTGTYFQNSGGPAGWIPGMQQAISQRYDAIVLICGIDTNLMTPQVKAATSAGIAVIDSGLGDTSNGAQSDPLVTAQTNIPNAQSIRRAVDVAILDHRQEPFTAFMITSKVQGHRSRIVNGPVERCQGRVGDTQLCGWRTNQIPRAGRSVLLVSRCGVDESNPMASPARRV